MQIIPYILLAASILLETAKNIFSNSFSKKALINETDIYKFNTFLYIGSFFVLSLFKGKGYSLFTIITSLLFSISIWLNQYFFLKALKIGGMGFTTFLQGTSLIIPIIYGVFIWKESISLLQISMLLLLIIGMAFALNIKSEKLNKKWIIYSLAAMFFMGVIGIIQSTHQISSHANELVSFLRISFLFTIIINFFGWQIKEKKVSSSFKIKNNSLVYSVLSGVFIGFVHIINLYLAGTMRKIIFFPIINGGLIFVTLICDLIFFKEKLDKKQWIGIIIGTIALSFIGI